MSLIHKCLDMKARETHILIHVWWKELHIFFYVVSENSGFMYFQGLCVCSYRMPQSLGGAGRLEGEKFSISESSIGYIINPSGTEAGVSLSGIFLSSPFSLTPTSSLTPLLGTCVNSSSASPPWGLASLTAVPRRGEKAMRPTLRGTGIEACKSVRKYC